MNIDNSWVEKYRPNNLNDIITQNNIINSLKNAIKLKNIPHLIFSGPSGCGKTSTILALAKELYGNDISNKIIELNASDERGINIIRDKIKTYAKQSVNIKNNSPPWKIIILDEADTMTPDSQFALRRIIEEYSKITRFCIICNYHSKIIEPIISRCSLFRFKIIENDHILLKLEEICKNENIIYDKNIFYKIIDISRGDLRKAINLLQKCYNYNTNKIENNILDEISGVISNDVFLNLMDNVLKKNTKIIDEIINDLFNKGYSLINQIVLFHNYILNLNISSKKKSNILCKLVEIDQSLIKGCDEYILYMKLIYHIMIII
jgi:replication factor C subunit 2/4